MVRRCLAKAPEERWQTALDLQMELKWIAEESPQTLAPAASLRTRSSSLSLTALLIIITAVVSAGAAWMLKPVGENSGKSISRLSVALGSDEVMAELDNPNIALSADGTKLAYVAVKENVTRLYVRALDSLESKPLDGTEGASNPFFSPNGEWIGFFANARLKKVSVTGGTVQNLANASNPRGGTWGPDDVIYFAPTPVIGISKVAASGGEQQQVTSLDRTKGRCLIVCHRFCRTGRL